MKCCVVGCDGIAIRRPPGALGGEGGLCGVCYGRIRYCNYELRYGGDPTRIRECNQRRRWSHTGVIQRKEI